MRRGLGRFALGVGLLVTTGAVAWGAPDAGFDAAVDAGSAPLAPSTFGSDAGLPLDLAAPVETPQRASRGQGPPPAPPNGPQLKPPAGWADALRPPSGSPQPVPALACPPDSQVQRKVGLRQSDLILAGDCDTHALMRLRALSTGAFKACVSRQAATSAVPLTRVTLQASFNSHGQILASPVEAQQAGHGAVETCMSEELQRWTVGPPKPDGPCTARWRIYVDERVTCAGPNRLGPNRPR